jgi:hypothetical protein
MSEERASVLVRLPKDLKQRLGEQARQQGVSVNQLINYSLTREVAYMEAQSYFDQRLEGKTEADVRARFKAVKAKIADRPVPEWDRIE